MSDDGHHTTASTPSKAAGAAEPTVPAPSARPATCWVSTRGDGGSELVHIDLDACEVTRRLPVRSATTVEAPATKRGTAGLGRRGRHLVVATWNTVALVDPGTGATAQVWADRRFSDLHGLHVDAHDRVWVTSTNIDGVLVIDGDEVDLAWCAEPDDRDRLARDDRDIGVLSKEQLPYHRLHVNDVHVTSSSLVVTFLGIQGRSTIRDRAARRLLGADHRRDRRLGRRWRDGGMIVTDRTSGDRRIVANEGLHDLVEGPGGDLYATEYFGAHLVAFDGRRLRRVALSPVPDGYLTRGLMFTADHVWVGHTVRRGVPGAALVREYALDGAWTGRQVEIAGCTGPYALLAGATGD